MRIRIHEVITGLKSMQLLLFLFICITLAACEGGNDTTVPIVVSARQNPVLVNYSTIVAANFSNYTTYVKFGSPITFTVNPDTASFSHVTKDSASFSGISTVTRRTVKTDVRGMAWVTVRSRLPGKFVITAISDSINGTSSVGGSTTVSFIDQPALIQVRLGLRKPLSNVGELSFDLVNTHPDPVFVNFSGSTSPLIFAQDPTPIIPGIPEDGVTSLGLNSLKGINMNALTPLFRFDYVPIAPSAPNFTLANIACSAADINATPLTATLFIMSTTYFDAAGNELFH